ncbi:E3 ubiquitin-protein ligase KEG-like isoform X1 [Carica papaya]|uniref:E3 ubiquitin-protein ligase KEG-like isoform X1 n=2 Tax=Carica papaya TaxID=3649 RepID=UPI000B8C9CA5|nr:E3 ubiquitin-protein ligase KEG-like isoform X1 [Carica papaya]
MNSFQFFAFHNSTIFIATMAQRIKAPRPPASFEFELFEGDPDHLRTVVATPTQISPWIAPASLKLKHRIGRGPFGDVWLATHHQSADDFDEYHEVAVKMLHCIEEDRTQTFTDKFEEIFLKCRELQEICWLHGISVINGKICIAMKYYEESVADRIALRKRGQIPLSTILRYGVHMARGIKELHTLGLLVLNLKPSNFLINDHDQLVLGDFGIPYLLLGISWSDPDMALRLGTPNYMAPEQWEPELRGPLSFETDAWGFGCSIVEMLSGNQPWFGKSVEQIYDSVVIKQEKPDIPSGLPPAVENVINGCFEYDLRNRPLMTDILHAFESSQNAVYIDGGWIGLGSQSLAENASLCGYSSWFLSEDHFQVGDTVRSRKPINACKPQNIDLPEGTVVGLDCEGERKSFVLVKVPGIRNPLTVQGSILQSVTSGFAVGDWVCLKDESTVHSPVGILHSVYRDGRVAVGFIGLETLRLGKCSNLRMATPYYVGQFVRLKANVSTPRFKWPRKSGRTWATGRILQVLPNGCLVVDFPGRFVFGDESNRFLADPAEVEPVSFESCPGIIGKYRHMEDFHWAVRPLTIVLGMLMAGRIGISVGRGVNKRMKKNRRNCQEGQAAGNAAWLPPPVANIIFREGVPAAAR